MFASLEMTNEKFGMEMLFFCVPSTQKEVVFLTVCVVWKGGIRGFINHTAFVKGYVATSEEAQSASAIRVLKKAIILHQPDCS